ncbi:hypothetical protein D3C71_1316800 [compost metagenome]
MNGFAIYGHSDGNQGQRQHRGKRQLPADEKAHGEQHNGEEHGRVDKRQHTEAYGSGDSADIIGRARHQVAGTVLLKERRCQRHQASHESGTQQPLNKVGASE